MALVFMEGNEAVAASCDFFANYPIPPTMTIFNNMLKLLPQKKCMSIQAEDEIASILKSRIGHWLPWVCWPKRRLLLA